MATQARQQLPEDVEGLSAPPNLLRQASMFTQGVSRTATLKPGCTVELFKTPWE